MAGEQPTTVTPGDKETIVEELTRPIIKLILALIGLLVIRFIVTRLPGLDTSIPETPITFAVLAGGIITLIMSVIIANFGREIEPRLNRAIAAPVSVANDMASIVKQFAFLVAVIVAYNGLDSLLLPFLVPDPGAWTYDIGFLLLALVPTGIIAQRMFRNLEEITDMLTEQVKTATVNEVECADCGEVVRASLEYCPNCGSEVDQESGQQPSQSRGSICPNCEADVDPGATFCGNCGTDLEDEDADAA